MATRLTPGVYISCNGAVTPTLTPTFDPISALATNDPAALGHFELPLAPPSPACTVEAGYDANRDMGRDGEDGRFWTVSDGTTSVVAFDEATRDAWVAAFEAARD